jgi:hypothetical protein
MKLVKNNIQSSIQLKNNKFYLAIKLSKELQAILFIDYKENIEN